MFMVVLDILEQNESHVSVLFNSVGTVKSCHVVWPAGLFQSQLVLLMKDKGNISKILLDNILPTDILARGSDF